MEDTILQILKPYFRGKRVWDYKVYGPVSLDDRPVVTVTVIFEREKGTTSYEIPLTGKVSIRHSD